MRDNRTLIGMGCAMLGSQLNLVASHGQHPVLSAVAEFLIAISFTLLILQLWTYWRK
jgi:hypothetical protein